MILTKTQECLNATDIFMRPEAMFNLYMYTHQMESTIKTCGNNEKMTTNEWLRLHLHSPVIVVAY